MSKNLICCLLAFILSGLWPVYPDSLEIQFYLDGAYKFSERLIYSSPEIKASVSSHHKIDKPEGFFYGLLTPWMAIGSLDSSGLAAEVENPGSGSVNRLTESTFFSSNLRSRSKNGRGIAIFLPNRRMGMATLDDSEGVSNILWITPLKSRLWELEFLTQFKQLEYKKADDSWFPEYAGRPQGQLFTLAQRLKWQWKTFKSSFTIIASGGIRYNDGYLGAFTFMWGENSWRARARMVYASPSFRNSRGKKLDSPMGGYFIIQRRKKTGLQFKGTYSVSASPSSIFGSEIETGLGWNFRFWNFWLYSDLSIVEQNQDKILKNLSGQASWKGKKLSVEMRLNRHWSEGWKLRFNLSFEFVNGWDIGTKVDLVNKNEAFLVSLGIRMAIKVNNNKILLRLLVNDLPRDWQNGPGSASDLTLDIRWIMNSR